MNDTHFELSIKILVAFYGAGLILSLWFLDMNMPEWDIFLDQLIFLFLIYLVHKRQSRTAAIAAFLLCLGNIVTHSAALLGSGTIFLWGFFSAPDLSIYLLIQMTASVLLFYKLIIWSWESHRLRNTSTNWRNVIIVTAITIVWIVYILSIFFFVFVDIADYITNPDQRPIIDNIASALTVFLGIAGVLRVLPGVQNCPTVSFGANESQN